MTFQLPIKIEECSEADQLLVAAGACPRCQPPAHGARPVTLEHEFSGAGREWLQCSRCLIVFVTPVRAKHANG